MDKAQFNNKVVTIPERSELLERLNKISNSNHVREKLFPKILEMAGTEKYAAGIALGLRLAFLDCTNGLPSMILPLLLMSQDAYVDALTDDEEIRREAKAILAK